MTEPDVTITDYLVGLEAIVFAALIYRSVDTAAGFRGPFVVFFAGTAAAAIAGGTVHGFYAGADAGVGRALWRTTLLALGGVAAATWIIAARLLAIDALTVAFQIIAGIVAIVYAGIVLAGHDRFSLAIAQYLPPAIVLLVAFVVRFATGRADGALAGAGGMFLTFAAALVQWRRIALHPVYFNHNALYHVVQAVALGMVFGAARALG